MVEGILWTGRDVDQRVTAFAYDDAWPVTYSRKEGGGRSDPNNSNRRSRHNCIYTLVFGHVWARVSQ